MSEQHPRILIIGQSSSDKATFIKKLCHSNTPILNKPQLGKQQSLLKEHEVLLRNSRTNVILVDTPDFTDDTGDLVQASQDDELLESLSKIGSVSCVLIVIKKDQPINETMQQFLQKYNN